MKNITEKQSFDTRWNSILIVNSDLALMRSIPKLITYFTSKGDNSKIFLITNNEEIGYITPRAFFPLLNKNPHFADVKSFSTLSPDIDLMGDPIFITINPDKDPVFTTSLGNTVEYVCPDISCTYQAKKLEVVPHNYLCLDCSKKLVKKE